MNHFNLIELAKEKLIICAHRGVWGGNIPCNVALSYDIAVAQGADMVELDVTASADGELFVFHPGQESRQLNISDIDIRKMPAEEVKKLRLANLDGKVTEHPIWLFEDMLEHLKGKCFINVDKFGDNPERIIRAIKRHDMAEQIVVKSAVKDELLDMIETYAPDLQYLGIIDKDVENHDKLMSRKLNYVGLEVVFADDSAPIASEEFRDRLHRDGKLVWGNSILFSYRKRLAADHSDDVALAGDPDKGWGWFAENHFDIIQTDWPLALSLYLDQKGLRYR